MAAALATAVDHHQSGRIDLAEGLYRKVLESAPGQPDALHLLGVIAHQGGRDSDAVELIGKAIAAKPGVSLYHNNMGAALRALGRDVDAIPHYRRAVELDPNSVGSHLNLGNALDHTGEDDAAGRSYQTALDLDPGHADAHTALGGLLAKRQQFEAAAVHFRRAAELDPDSAISHNNVGNMLTHEGDRDGAIAEYRHAIALDVAFADAHLNLRNVLSDENRPLEALEAIQDAAGTLPDRADVTGAMGLALAELGRHAEALAVARKAVELAPDWAEAWCNLGNAFRAAGCLEDAIEAFTSAVRLAPDFDVAIINRGLADLLLGRFSDGWRDLQTRFSVRRHGDTLWRRPVPEDLSGKRLYVVRDQGLGDEIFFLRFIAELKERGAWIAYQAQTQVAAMIGRLGFIDAVFDEAGESPMPEDIDFRLSAGDLPCLLGLASMEDIPPTAALEPLPGKQADIDAALAALGPKPYIGITWRAGIQKRDRLSKIAPDEMLANILRRTAGTVIAVQRLPLEGEIATMSERLGRPVHDMTALNDDLEAMLALMGRIDEYVCVSNTNVHLRHAVGRPCRVLVPHPPDYRWMQDGAESPWFPGAAIYRETADGGWEGAFERLAADLAAACPPAD